MPHGISISVAPLKRFQSGWVYKRIAMQQTQQARTSAPGMLEG